jgi:TfoX/Sxy family transcriptional regulator of competence genes
LGNLAHCGLFPTKQTRGSAARRECIMAYAENDGDRVREALGDRVDVVEKRMFGGLCFMVRGHMAVGLTAAELMVRVGPEAWEDALAQPHARVMDFTGKSMKGFVFVDPAGWSTKKHLAAWVARGIAHAESLPPK